MTIREALVDIERRLRAAGTRSPVAEALQLLEAATGLCRADILVNGAKELSAEEGGRIEAMVVRREAREPLQHITGRAHFYGLELAVDGRVLVPRPETERLVELVLEELRAADATHPLVLDVGTGSGAVALAIKSEFRAAEVVGTDVSQDALDVARANAGRLGLDVAFSRSDLLAGAAAAAAAARCAVLVANLPYLPEADAADLEPEVEADPALALFAANGGTELAERLAEQAWGLLLRGSLLALELDPRNVHRVGARLEAWREVTVKADLVGRPRFLLARR